jgi:S1-C subfamily serine protease
MGIPSWLGRTIAISAIGVALAFAYLIFFKPFPDLSLEHLSSPYLKIARSDGGHGSGSHLGGGYILTASHVVAGAEELSIVMPGGVIVKATVVVQDEPNDTAVIRVHWPDDVRVGSAKTECRDPDLGELIFATGNPADLTDVHTRGYVARLPASAWRLDSAFVADMTAASGMSGGAVTDARGVIVGFISSALTAAPLILVVPPSAFCPILKKAGAI